MAALPSGAATQAGAGETLSRLAGDWRILQLADGHRYATDDVITAHSGWRSRPDATAVLDLGAGVGSVGLMVLRLLSEQARLVAVEVQQVSAELARRSAALNGVAERVEVRHGDLRDRTVLGPRERFDLIVANPPFLPPGAGWLPQHPQKRAARYELHGDIRDYCRVAAAHLGARGRFAFCHAAADPRPARAVHEAGLILLERWEVVFRAGRPPHLAVYVCGAAGSPAERPPLGVRDGSGQHTPAYRQVLRDIGIVA